MSNNNDLQLQSETGVSAIEKTDIIERSVITGTPFVIVKTEQGMFLAMGRYRITELVEDEAYLRHLVESKNWELIMTSRIRACALFVFSLNLGDHRLM